MDLARHAAEGIQLTRCHANGIFQRHALHQGGTIVVRVAYLTSDRVPLKVSRG